MSDLQKRGSYMPRRVRERALHFSLALVSRVSRPRRASLLLICFIGATLPIVALVAAAVCVFMARRVIAS